MITHEYDLDIVPGGVPLIAHLSQYDTDMSLRFRLYASKGTLQIESGTTAKIHGRKPDGSEFAFNGVVSGNDITFSVHEDMTDTAGDINCEITLTHGIKELNTANFLIAVKPTKLAKDAQIQSCVNFWNGEYLLLAMNIEQGEDAVYPYEDPTREETEHNFYEFNGWSKDRDDNTPDDDALSNIENIRNVYACYDIHIKSKIEYYNGLIKISEDTIIDGGHAIYNGEIPTKEPTAYNTFTFAGWSLFDDNRPNANALKNVTADRIVYAAYSISGQAPYTVNFIQNGVTLQSSLVPISLSAHYTGPTPTKTSTANADYGFIGWSRDTDDNTVDEGALTDVRQNRTLYPCFVVTHTRATIVFWNGSQRLISQMILDGADAIYTGATPIKSSTQHEDYDFSGWSLSNNNTPVENALTAVVADRNVYACYVVSHTRAIINFWNDSECVASYTIIDGANAIYEESTPTKPSTKNEDYEFSGWSKGANDNTPDADALTAVTADRNVYACFIVSHTHATVTFYNGSEVIGTQNIDDGADASYSGSTPTRASTEHADYTFSGWSLGSDDNTVDANALTNVIRDRKVYACYTITTKATISFYNGTSFIRSLTILNGGDATYTGATPTRASTEHADYTFSGWSLGNDDNTVDANALKAVTTDREVYACYSITIKATLSFYNGSSFIRSVVVVGGGDATYTGVTPTRASTEHADYTFSGWSKDNDDNTVDSNALKAVTTDRNVYACYSITTKATISFYNGSTFLRSVVVTNGGNATYPGTTPYRTGDANNTYTFIGWSRGSDDNTVDSNALTAVTSDRDVYACFNHTTTATVVYYNGTNKLAEQTVTGGATGGTATYPLNTLPIRIGEDTVHDQYTFIGWSLNNDDNTVDANALKNVTTNRNVYACFEYSKVWTVKFYNEGTLLQTLTKVKNATNVTYTGPTPTKSADARDTSYTFIGWKRDMWEYEVMPSALSNIGADLNIFAVFKGAHEITDTWTTICSRAAQGTIGNYYTVGQYKAIHVDGDTNYAQIKYINSGYRETDGLTVGSYAPVTFILLLPCIPDQMAEGTIDGDGWEWTIMRARLNRNLDIRFEEGMRLHLALINVQYNKFVYQDGSTHEEYHTCDDHVWLPKVSELVQKYGGKASVATVWTREVATGDNWNYKIGTIKNNFEQYAAEYDFYRESHSYVFMFSLT